MGSSDKYKIEDVLERASKLSRQLPRYMRNESVETAYDRLHKACWNLTDEQIDKVAEFAKSLNS